MQLLDPEVEGLIESLDPYRDYGEGRTHEDIARLVREGRYRLAPAPGATSPHPMITDVSTGKRVKGSATPQPATRGFTKQIEWTRKQFFERAEHDFPRVYAALLRACDKEDSRAIKLFMDHFLGAPEKFMGGASDEAIALMKQLFDRGERKEIVIDATTGERRD